MKKSVEMTMWVVFVALILVVMFSRSYAQSTCSPLSINTRSLLSGTIGQEYRSGIRTSGGMGVVTVTLTSGSLPPGLTLESSGYFRGIINGLGGEYQITVQARDRCSPTPQIVTQSFSITVPCPPLSISLPLPPSGTVGQAYLSSIRTSGGRGPMTLTLTSGSLPPGLTLAAHGLISGTPTTGSEGVHQFTAEARDSCTPTQQKVTKGFSVAINVPPPPPCPALSITTPHLPGGVVNQAYSPSQIKTAGGQGAITLNVASGTLPPGLNLSSSGLISGTPTTAGNYSFTVKATDSCTGGPQSFQVTFALLVNPAPCPVLSSITASLPAGTAGQAYSQQIQTSGGQGIITLGPSSVGLPPGLILSSSGLISGTPTKAGNYSFGIKAMDSCTPTPQNVTRSLNIVINAPARPVVTDFKVERVFISKADAPTVPVTGILWEGQNYILNCEISYEGDKQGTCQGGSHAGIGYKIDGKLMHDKVGCFAPKEKKDIHALSWTDYDQNDPGIQMLEVLAYSITDLNAKAFLAGSHTYECEILLTKSKDSNPGNNKKSMTYNVRHMDQNKVPVPLKMQERPKFKRP